MGIVAKVVHNKNSNTSCPFLNYSKT